MSEVAQLQELGHFIQELLPILQYCNSACFKECLFSGYWKNWDPQTVMCFKHRNCILAWGTSILFLLLSVFICPSDSL